jgi:outer membrane immunogenic protein
MTVVKLVRMGVAAGALIVGVQANAADLSGYGGGYSGYKDGPAYAPTSIWSGFYAGVNGGYGWRQSSDQFAYPACDGGVACGGLTYPAFDGVGASGGFGGGQIGYNWQSFFGTPALVAGVETDIQGSGIGGKTVTSLNETFKTNLDWFGTVRGRLGYSSYNALLYFTGGFAYGGLRGHGEDTTYIPASVYDSSSTGTGYVLGGGLEYKFNPAWSLKAEYQYLDFGKHDVAFASGNPTPGPTIQTDGSKLTNDAFHTVRIGLNYWVSPAYEPLK